MKWGCMKNQWVTDPSKGVGRPARRKNAIKGHQWAAGLDLSEVWPLFRGPWVVFLVLCHSPHGRCVGQMELVEANFGEIAAMFWSGGPVE